VAAAGRPDKATTAIRLDRETLLTRDGIGPWLAGAHNYSEDNKYNSSLSMHPWPSNTKAPEGIADTLFDTAQGVSFSAFGQVHRFDYYGAANAYAGSDFNCAYGVQIDRLATAQKNGHQGSADALAVLHNVARQGGLIAFVQSHSSTTSGELRLFGDRSSERLETVLADIASRRTPTGGPLYHAALFAACNEDGCAIPMDGIGIPVIANTRINGIFGGEAQVHFPQAA
jgi:hypothetical protein